VHTQRPLRSTPGPHFRSCSLSCLVAVPYHCPFPCSPHSFGDSTQVHIWLRLAFSAVTYTDRCISCYTLPQAVLYPARCHKFPQRKEGLLLGAPGGREGRRQRKRGVSDLSPQDESRRGGGPVGGQGGDGGEGHLGGAPGVPHGVLCDAGGAGTAPWRVTASTTSCP